jgi:hypothetical protein
MTKDDLRAIALRNPQVSIDENQTGSKLSHPKLKPELHRALERAISGTAPSVGRITVSFTGFRVRPCDPDNFSGGVKNLIDGLRHANLIPGDEPWKIILKTEQVKVKRKTEELTVIEIDTGR